MRKRWTRSLLVSTPWLPVVGSLTLQPGVLQTICDRLAGPAMLMLFVVTMTGLGARVLQGQLATTHRKLERLCIAFSIGWATAGIVLLLLAVIGAYQPVAIALFSVSTFLWFGIGLDGREAGYDLFCAINWRRMIRFYTARYHRAIPAVLTVGVILMALLWAAGPVWDWDSEMYHLPVSQFLLENHGLAVSYDRPLMNLPSQAYLWFGLGLSAGQPNFSQLLVCAAAIVTSILAGCFSARWIGVHTALWTPLVYWSGAIVIAVASTARVEPIYSLMFLTAIVLLAPVLFHRGKLDMATIILTGLCLGTAAGSKYQGLYGWVIIGLWLVVSWFWHSKLRTLHSVIAGTAIFLIGFLVTSPWWVKNTIAWQNPVYPMFDRQHTDPTSLTHSNPYHGRGAVDWAFLFNDTIELFTHPSRFSGPPNHFPHYLFLLLPLLLFVRRHRVVIAITILGVTYYVLSLSLSHILRHMYPSFALLSIGVAYIIARFETRLKMTVFLPGILSFATLFVLVLPSRVVRMPELVCYLIGSADERDLLESISPGFHASIDWLNRNTHPDAGIMMCWDAREFRLNRRTLIDPGRRTWDLLASHATNSPADVASYLKENNIDYVLVNDGALRYHVYESRVTDESFLKEFERQRDLLVGQSLQTATKHGRVTIYKVIGPDAGDLSMNENR